MKGRRFTNTALPVFSGAECWFQHFHVVQAIVKSNGWPEETVCTLERRGIKCSSASDEGEAEVMDGPGEWTFGVLPISWQIGGSEKAVRERVSPTGIGPGYVCN